MPSDPSATHRRLNDIRHHIDLAGHFIGGRGYEEFREDTLVIYAVIRCLEIISEASRRLPDAIKTRNPSIAWREVAAAGNIYRHEYETVNVRRVWQTLQLALPPLRVVIERELAHQPSADSGITPPGTPRPPR